MSSHEWLSDEDLPPEAGDFGISGFQPNEKWLAQALPKQQYVAMKRWFLDRYEDPAQQCPYNSEDGYQFIYGGPYDPNDKLQDEFSHIVPIELINELTQELYMETGDQWSPIESEYPYDDDFSSAANTRDDPYIYLKERSSEVDRVLEIGFDSTNAALILRLVHSWLIAALEAYLADTFSVWVAINKTVQRQFIKTNNDFKEQKLSLAMILDRVDGLEDEIEEYLLQKVVWHRLDKVKPMVERGLGIEMPPIDDLMRAILVRHDIVHRAGKTKDGIVVSVTSKDIQQLQSQIDTFAKAIESELSKKYPRGAETSVDF